ncbi:hypothetical protein PV396_40350 [Streptomyces sp. ME02-8801-2C]|nr:hypothetical protein [Streptomyces sp. ME02-8801-2C]MDX3458121.1 hypothetical protein [Streptomyces sp. ME02-8801-2C]
MIDAIAFKFLRTRGIRAVSPVPADQQTHRLPTRQPERQAARLAGRPPRA